MEPTPTPSSNSNSKQPFYKHHKFPVILAILIVAALIGSLIYSLIFHNTKVIIKSPSDSVTVKKAAQYNIELSKLDSRLAVDDSVKNEVEFTATAKARLNNFKQMLNDDQVKEALALAKPGEFDNAPKAADKYLEKEVTLKGYLNVIHGEKFDGDHTLEGTEYHEYHIGNRKPSDKRLYVTQELSTKYAYSKVAAQTIQFGVLYAAESTEVTITQAAAPIAAAPRQMRIAVVMMNLPPPPVWSSTVSYAYGARVKLSAADTVIYECIFSSGGVTGCPVNSPAPPNTTYWRVHNPSASATVSQAQTNFFGATNSVAEWYSQVSGGQVAVTGQVYGYYNPTGVPSGSCDLGTWNSAAAAAAAADGYVASNYDNLVVYTPGQSCPFAGIAYVGWNGVLLNGYIGQSVAEHELGHNLGLWHAGAYSCGAGPFATSCLYDYGDPYDTMGSGNNRHFSATHKAMLGWIPPSEIQTISSGTQTFTLTSSEKPVVAGSTQIVRIQGSAGRVYEVEHREPYGYDTGLLGILIRIKERVTTDDTTLPTNNPPLASFFLPTGQSYVDAAQGLTVKTLSISGSTAQIQVTLPTQPCVVNPPSIGLTPLSVSLAPGAVQSYNVSVRNNDASTCSSSVFTLGAPNITTLFSHSVSGPNSVTLAPGATGNITVNVTSPIYQAKSTSASFSENITAPGHSPTTSNSSTYNIAPTWPFLNCGHC